MHFECVFCFISGGAIFSRSGPHERVDCLDLFSAPCASLSSFLKRTATITQVQGVRPFDPEPIGGSRIFLGGTQGQVHPDVY